MNIKPLSYDVELTLKDGALSHITHESKNFGVYIDENRKVNILLLSDISMLHTNNKVLNFFQENGFGVRFLDNNLDLKKMIEEYNSQSLTDILEEKEVSLQVYDYKLDKDNFQLLDSLINDDEEIQVYFYLVEDLEKFNSSFSIAFTSLLENNTDIELDVLFDISNLTYFDVYPFMDKFKNKSQDMNIIDGCSLKKFKITVKK